MVVGVVGVVAGVVVSLAGRVAGRGGGGRVTSRDSPLGTVVLFFFSAFRASFANDLSFWIRDRRLNNTNSIMYQANASAEATCQNFDECKQINNGPKVPKFSVH